MKLAKLGYCGGNPEVILNSPVDIVLSMLDYESFVDNYEIEYIELNKAES